MNALGTQISGKHYKDMKLQPLELGYILGETPCFVKAAKYLTRDKNDKVENIDKADHCIRVEAELKKHLWKYTFTGINRLYWKNFRKEEIHPLIWEFTEDNLIRLALHRMFLKDYDRACDYVALYKLSVKGEYPS